jgi:tripartite ATP-independent transporter DctP family solute receptor
VNNNPKEELMNKLLSGVCLGAALLSAPAWSQGLQLAHNAAPGNPKAEASTKFAELVAEKTDGRVSIVVGESAQFGDDVEALTNMRLGTIAFSANSQGATSGVVPEFAVVGLPFLFKDLPQAWAVLDGPVGDELAEAAEAKGLVLLALWDNGIRHVSNNVRPIETPEDLAGIKLRTPPDPITVDIFEALGASPTPLPFSELYIALQQGVVDGQENPLMNIYADRAQVRIHAALRQQGRLRRLLARGPGGDPRGGRRGGQAQSRDVAEGRLRAARRDGSRRRHLQRGRPGSVRREDPGRL